MIELDATTAPPPPSDPPRDLTPDELHAAGRHAIDWIARLLADPRALPVRSAAEPGDLLRRLPAEAPERGEPLAAILRDFEEVVLPHVTHWNHPGFHGYFSISASGPGMLAELLTAALDVNAMNWLSCPAATELEQRTTRWLGAWLGLPATWFGMIVDSASIAVFQALVAARDHADPRCREHGPSAGLVVYVSEQTHSSVVKAALAAGIGLARVRRLAVDGSFRLRAATLDRAIRDDTARGLRPFFAAATVGTTSSTAVDPVGEIADVCAAHGVWCHVDGAYGGSLAVLPECRTWLDGVARADSLVVNPHKLLTVPLDCSLLYTRHPDRLRAAFALHAEYLARTDAAVADETPVDYMDYGLALGRRFRALKLWFVLRWYGRAGVAAHLRRGLALARRLAAAVAGDERFVLAAPVEMGLVCFRLRAGDAATRSLMEAVHRDRRQFVTHTVLDGRFTVRAAFGNHRAEERDADALWSALRAAADEVLAAPGGGSSAGEPPGVPPAGHQVPGGDGHQPDDEDRGVERGEPRHAGDDEVRDLLRSQHRRHEPGHLHRRRRVEVVPQDPEPVAEAAEREQAEVDPHHGEVDERRHVADRRHTQGQDDERPEGEG